MTTEKELADQYKCEIMKIAQYTKRKMKDSEYLACYLVNGNNQPVSSLQVLPSGLLAFDSQTPEGNYIRTVLHYKQAVLQFALIDDNNLPQGYQKPIGFRVE